MFQEYKYFNFVNVFKMFDLKIIKNHTFFSSKIMLYFKFLKVLQFDNNLKSIYFFFSTNILKEISQLCHLNSESKIEKLITDLNKIS